jgi:RNA polymerase sigma-70 factor (ECF subfamily)
MSDIFRTTRWSVVLSAARDGTESRRALEWLCETYWQPIYVYIRRRGHDAENAADLTQSFILTLLEGKPLQRIDPKLGKFRAYLLASVNHFLSNERDRTRAMKRRAEQASLWLDLEDAERQYQLESAPALGPDELFEAKWARTVLQDALRRLEQDYDASNGTALFRRLRGHLTGEDPAYDRLADELGMTAGALRVAVHRMRRKLGTLLREAVAHTVSDPKDVDGELRRLLEAAGRGA